MAVNSTAWRKFPIAPRDTNFNADDAIARLQSFSAGSVQRFNSAFLWRNSQAPANNKNSYRLPIADVVNGKLTMIPHAVFTAASILSGAHGGLENVVGEEERNSLKRVITEIYDTLQKAYGDPRVVPPWLRGGNKEEKVLASLTAAVNGSAASLPLADTSRAWDAGAARARLWSWSGGDYRKYRKGFLWWDSGNPEQKGSYKLPVADVIDGKLTLIPRAVNAVASVLGGGRGGVDIPDADASKIQGLVDRMQKRFGAEQAEETNDSESERSTTASSVVPIRPPAEWFTNPTLQGPTPLAITADGQVTGHLALWNVCHFGIRDVCRMAPKSRSGYKYFMDGTVLTADGSEQKVGKITVGTGHANLRLGYVPAADHYDNTGNAVAIVAAGEDKFGIWVHGALTADATEARIAELRRSPLSGDWRPTPDGLELVAALAVNSPGFPIVGFTASGEIASLVAAGMVLSEEEIAALKPEQVTEADEVLLQRINAYDQKVAGLEQKLRGTRLRNVLAGLPKGDK
jgi:hypothetical protein